MYAFVLPRRSITVSNHDTIVMRVRLTIPPQLRVDWKTAAVRPCVVTVHYHTVTHKNIVYYDIAESFSPGP